MLIDRLTNFSISLKIVRTDIKKIRAVLEISANNEDRVLGKAWIKKPFKRR